jgi:2-methylaconitate cis-trans-isomerase PrpF
MKRKLRATYYRGGTSRAVIFRGEDLPAIGPDGDTRARDAIITAIMGSPDPDGRQLDGMGGGISSLSKIAIVSPSARNDAEVDYTFGQVGIDTATVSYRGNCGNISSAIGPFAIEEGMVEARDGTAAVRIFNTNTQKLLVAEFEVINGLPCEDGTFEIDGVAGSAAPIKLSFIDPTGAVTGKMFPTGRERDRLVIAGGAEIEATLVDVTNPTVIVSAADLIGPSDDFATAPFTRPETVAKAEDIRVAAAIAMGIAPDEQFARTRIPNLPLVAAVMPPRDFTASSSYRVPARRVDIVTHMYSPPWRSPPPFRFPVRWPMPWRVGTGTATTCASAIPPACSMSPPNARARERHG